MMDSIEFLEYRKEQVWYENTPVIFVSSNGNRRIKKPED
jgi:hypothetical protein